MANIIGFFEFIVQGLLTLIVWLIIANAIVSWLVAFNVLNMRNPTAAQIVRGLDRAADPFLRPLRRFIPPLGGMDITPVIFILVVYGIKYYLVPLAFDSLRAALIHTPV